MAQTPEQRLRNQKFAKAQDASRGKPGSAVKPKEKPLKSPISPVWLGILAFIIFGGLVFELLSRFFF